VIGGKIPTGVPEEETPFLHASVKKEKRTSNLSREKRC